MGLCFVQACFATILTKSQLQRGNFKCDIQKNPHLPYMYIKYPPSTGIKSCTMRVFELLIWLPYLRPGSKKSHPQRLPWFLSSHLSRSSTVLLTPGIWANLTFCILYSLVRLFVISPPSDKNPTCPLGFCPEHSADQRQSVHVDWEMFTWKSLLWLNWILTMASRSSTLTQKNNGRNLGHRIKLVKRANIASWLCKTPYIPLDQQLSWDW